LGFSTGFLRLHHRKNGYMKRTGMKRTTAKAGSVRLSVPIQTASMKRAAMYMNPASAPTARARRPATVRASSVRVRSALLPDLTQSMR
jgi:hypothetical protein